jgi:hypothetical protein
MNAIDNYLWVTPTLVGARTSAKYFQAAGKTIVAYHNFDIDHYNQLATNALKQEYLNLCTSAISGTSLDTRCVLSPALSSYPLVGSVRNPYDSFVSQWRRHVIGAATGVYRAVTGQTIQSTFIKESINNRSSLPIYVSYTPFKDYIAKLVFQNNFGFTTTSSLLSSVNYTTYKYSQVTNVGKFLNQNNRTFDYVIHYESLSADSFNAPFVDQTSSSALSGIDSIFGNNIINTVENAEYLRALITIKCINEGVSALTSSDYINWVAELSNINTLLPQTGGGTFTTCLTPEYADNCYNNVNYAQYRGIFSTDQAFSITSLYADWRSFYDDWTATTIWNEYKETFDMFGYSQTSYLSS